MELQNRIMLSPLCQYSADDGHLTDWHLTHLGGILQRGPGLTTVEATSVSWNGRITPQDSGIYLESHIEPLKRIVTFAHSQNQKIAIQLAHAGRKASDSAPWLEHALASEEVGGWPDKVVGASAIAFDDVLAIPKAMTVEDIEEYKKDFARGVKYALEAGFDAIEIHSAHGYLLHSFLSPISNQRPSSDPYSGHSFETRTKLLLEVARLTRSLIPPSMPLLVRISGGDFMDHPDSPVPDSWKESDTVRLAPLLEEAGVDLLDVSGGGIHPSQKIPKSGEPGYQSHFARAVKKGLNKNGKGTMLVGTVGGIKTASTACELLADSQPGEGDALDLVIVGRMFQKNPGLVWSWADELGVKVQAAHQIAWGFRGRHTVQQKPKKQAT